MQSTYVAVTSQPCQYVNVLSCIALTCCVFAPVTAASVPQNGMNEYDLLRIDFTSKYTSGYSQSVRGETIRYHSPVPYVERSLLVRSLDRDRYIEWDTAPVQPDVSSSHVVLVFMAGIDVNEDVRTFDLYVNDAFALQFTNPSDAEQRVLSWAGASGVTAQFRITEIDKYDDAMGFVFLKVPRGQLREGEPIRLKVMGESAGRRTWFMIFEEPMVPGIRVRNSPALLRGNDGNRQLLRVDVLSLDEAGHFRMESPAGIESRLLDMGHAYLELPVPEVKTDTTVRLRFQLNDFDTAAEFRVRPVQPFEVYLIHHTHLDIGYTHHQDDVERIQWENLESALRLGAASEGFPEGERFIWNPEGLWAVESYLESHDDERRKQLIEGIRRGWIALDGLYANILSGIASSEGLMHALETAHRIGSEVGATIESAMLSDIPGFTWGLVPVLAQNGVKYLSIGPNFGHRIGYFSDELADRPFYWESPSGKERVLTWVSGAGYAWFHTGLAYEQLDNLLGPSSVFKYLDQLHETAYPYDMVYLRYNVGSDNGPTDPTLAETVRAWNARYLSPRVIISNTADVFREFESRYGSDLPVYRGDLTGHWEDGVASSARETAVVRRAAESLVQTETLAAMIGVQLDQDAVYRAWRHVLLYYEHTWGSWNSVSEPESEFTIKQWERKKQFADSASLLSDELRQQVLAMRVDDSPRFESVDVFNTLSWPRSDVVILPADAVTGGDRVVDALGKDVPSQRLRTGELAFLARNVPAFGAARYQLRSGAAEGRAVNGSGTSISNGDLRIVIDTMSGTIKSLVHGPAGWDFVQDEVAAGLNEYLYVSSRWPRDLERADLSYVLLHEAGPLVWSVETRSEAPGTNTGISSEICIYGGINRVDIVNRIDKALVYDPEAILYRFPFNIPDAEVRLDVPYGSFSPEREQIPGSAKNYMSVQRWVDVYNDRIGITFASGDVPLVQFGAVRTDATVAGWLAHVDPSATLFSYVMNNYWETNYRAAQEGMHEFRYSLRPHGGFSETDTERFAMEVGHPLVSVPVLLDDPLVRSPFELDATSTVATMLRSVQDGDGYGMRLYNAASASDVVRVIGGDAKPLGVRISDVWGTTVGPAVDELQLGPYETITLRLTLDGGRER